MLVMQLARSAREARSSGGYVAAFALDPRVRFRLKEIGKKKRDLKRLLLSHLVCNDGAVRPLDGPALQQLRECACCATGHPLCDLRATHTRGARHRCAVRRYEMPGETFTPRVYALCSRGSFTRLVHPPRSVVHALRSLDFAAFTRFVHAFIDPFTRTVHAFGARVHAQRSPVHADRHTGSPNWSRFVTEIAPQRDPAST
jgi:hypothetical protein